MLGRTLLAALLFVAQAAGAAADQGYIVSGSDTFAVGNGDVRSEISYQGNETLHTERHGNTVTYVARARYVRIDQGAKSSVTGSFSAELLPSGEQRDLRDRDPDYLTVLNQPFAVQLDAPTLHDLAHLRSDVPFEFPSPITGSPLHGHLRRISEGVVGGERALGVAFDAGGPMRGPLPDRPHLLLAGKIRMHGSAYYRAEDALLLDLDATLTISGNLANPEASDAVQIVYRRHIRAVSKSSKPAQHGSAATAKPSATAAKRS